MAKSVAGVGFGANGFGRSRKRGFRKALFASTALVGVAVASPAMAQTATGGVGGRSDSSATNAAGGTSGVAGGNGDGQMSASYDGTGGGGGGADAAGGTGGAGGNGTYAPGGTGGAAGTAGGNGGQGQDALGDFNTWGPGGGGGGGGGSAVFTSGTTTVSTNITGGNGGSGGNSINGGGGGGGAGGFGIFATGTPTITVNSGITVQGGNGGAGGSTQAYSQGGSGGGGGNGFSGSGTLINAGTISSGAGGVGGAGPTSGGGNSLSVAGVVGTNLSVTNSGTIVGSTGSNGQADAITFIGGTNSLTLTSGGVQGTLNGQVGIAGTVSFSAGTAGTATLANIVHGTGDFVKTDFGNLALTGVNNWTGTTTVSGGTLTGTASSISGSSIIANGGDFALVYQDTVAGTVAQDISGTGGLSISSSAPLNFSGDITLAKSFVLNSSASNVTLSGTRSGATNAAVLGSGVLTVANTGAIQGGNYNAVAANNSITVTNLGAISTTGTSANSSFASAVSAPGAAIAGTSGLTVTNGAVTNSTASIGGVASGIYSAGNTLGVMNYGSIVGDNASAINRASGNGLATIINTGGMIVGGVNAIKLTNTGALSLTNTGTIGTGSVAAGVFTTGGSGNAIDVAGNATVDNAGLISGQAGGLTAAGTLNLINRASGVINGRGTTTGNYDGVTVTGAATVLNAGNITGAVYSGIYSAGGGTFTNAAGGRLAGAAAGAGLVLDGGGTFNNYGVSGSDVNAATGGGAGVGGGNTAITVNLYAGSTTGTITSGSGNDTLAIYNGRGTAGVATSASGIVLQNAGTLAAASFGAINLGGGANMLMLRGTGDDTAANGAAGSFNIATSTNVGTLTKADNGTWTLTGAAVTPAIAINAGTGGTPGSGGLLIFSGTTGLTGTINVNGATIRATTGGAFGSGTITATDPTIQYGATGTYTNAIVLASTNTVTDPTRIQADAGVNATLTGQITQSGVPAQPLIFDGLGTITLTNGANNYAGLTTISNGTVVESNTGSALGTGGVLINSGAVLQFDGTGGNYVIEAGAYNGAGTIRFTSTAPGGGSILGNAGNVTFSLASGGLVDVVSGTVNGSSSGQGFWTGNKSDLSIAAGATFDGVEGNIIVDALNGAGTLRGGYAGVGSTTIGVDNGSGTFSGTIANSNSALTLIKQGTGTQTLSGTNIYTGTTTISGGTLALTGSGSIAQSASVTNNAIFDISGRATATSVNQLTGTGNVVLGANTLTANNGTPGTISGVIGGSGGFTKAGGGVLALTGANTYTGTTSVTGGVLALGAGGATGSIAGAVALSNNAQLQFNRTGTPTFTNAVSGTGSVRLIKNATVAAAITASGGVVVDPGVTLNVGVDAMTTGSIITGGTTVTPGLGSTINVRTGSLIRSTGGTTIGNVAGALTIDNAGTIDGTGGNTIQTPSATATLTNSGTISTSNFVAALLGAGSTAINSGTITGGTDATYGIGVEFNGSGTLTNQSGGTINGRGAAGVQFDGAGSVLNGASGNTTVQNASAVITGSVGIRALTTLALTNYGRVTGTNAVLAGVNVGGASSVLTNYGTMEGGAQAIVLNAGGTVYNYGASSLLTTTNSTDVLNDASGIYSNGDLTLTNEGAVNAVGISGSSYGVEVLGTGTITNSGTITSTNANGVYLGGSGSVGNTGTIMGGGRGLSLTGGGNYAVTNSGTGTITGTADDGITSYGELTVLNGQGATIMSNVNSAIALGAGDATITNAGVLTGGSGGSFGYAVQSNTDGLLAFDNYGSATGSQGGIVSFNTGAIVANLYAGSTTGSIVLGGADDSVAIYSGRGTSAAATVDNMTGLTLQNGGTLAAASVGAIDLGGGVNMLALRGTGDDSANNGAAGSFDLGTAANVSFLTKTDAGTWVLTGASASPAATILAGDGGAGTDGTLIFRGTTGLTGNITVNGAILRAESDGAFGIGTITTIDPTIQYGATGTYANNIVLNSSDTVGDPTQLLADDGVNATLTGAISENNGPQPLVINTAGSTGTITLTGNNTYTGTTTVAGGTLAVNGSTLSAANVLSGATLTGTGSLGATTIADGGILTGTQGSTLTLASLGLSSGSIINATFSAPGGAALFAATGDLILDGTVNVASTGAFGFGVYRLLSYGGTLTNNGLVVGSVPADAQRTTAQTSVSGQVNIVSSSGNLLFWDGGNAALYDNGAINGGSGTWTAISPTFTDANGLFNGPMSPQPGFAVFEANAGTVTVDNSAGAISVTGIQFASDGYVVTGDPIGLADPTTAIRVGDGTVAGAAFTATIGSALTGANALDKTDLGTLVLSGANTYTGLTTIDGGTLALSGGQAVADGNTILVTANGILALNANETIGALNGVGAVSLGSSTLTLGTNDLDSDFAGNASGTGGLTKVGGGTLKFTGTNTLSGTVTITGGTLALAGTGSLANATVADNAIFDIAGLTNGGASIVNLGGNGQVALGANTLTLSNGAGTFGGTITGSGGFTKQGGGTLILTGANAYSGATTIGAGTLQGTTATISGGNIVDNGTLAYVQNSSGSVAQAISGSGRVTVDGSGNANTITFNGNSNVAGGFTSFNPKLAFTGSNTSSATTVYLAGVNSQVDVAAGGSLTSSGANAVYANLAGGAVNNAGAIRSTSAGGAAVYLNAGGAIANAGGSTIAANGNAIYSLGTTALTNVGSVTSANGIAVFENAANGTTTITNQAGGAITSGFRGVDILNTASVTNAGTISGSTSTGVLLRAGGTVTNQASGVVTGGSGGVVFQNAAGTVTNAGRIDGATWGVLQNSGGYAITLNNLTAGTINGTQNNAIYTGDGAATIDNAGTLTGGNAAVYADGALMLTNSGVIRNLDEGTGHFAISGVYSSAANAQITNSGTIDSRIAGGHAIKLEGGTGRITNLAGGTLAGFGGGAAVLLSGAGYTIDLRQGSTVTGGIDASATTGANDVSVAGTLAGGYLGGSGVDTVTLVDTGAFTGVLNGGAGIDGLTLTGSGTGSANIGSLVNFETVTKTGTGRFNLSGTDASSANYSIQQGILSVSGGSAINDAALVDIAGAGTLDLAGSERIGALSGAGAVTLNANTLTIAGNQATNYAGIVSGSGGLVRTGTGSLTLSGANSYTGATRVNSGTLALGASNALADATNVVIDADGVLDLGQFSDTVASATIAGRVNGTGTLTAATYALNGATVNANLGAGVLTQASGVSTLNGASAATAIAINAGTLRLGANERLADTAAVNVAGGATFDLAGKVETVAILTGTGTTALGAGRLVIGGGNADFAYQGAITGTGDVDKIGTGTLTLAGSYPVTGRFNLIGGTTLFSGSTAGSVRIQGGTLSGTPTIAGNLLLASGMLSPGTAALPIGTVNAGSLTVSGGTYAVGFGGAVSGFGSDLLRIGGAATLTGGTVTTTAIDPAASYRTAQTYTILQAGSLAGTFANGSSFAQVNANSADLFWRLRYDLVPNSVLLEVRKVIDYAAGLGSNATPNQRAVGASLNGGTLLASDNWASILNNIVGQSPDQRRATYDSIGGEAISDVTTSVASVADHFTDMLRQRLAVGGAEGGDAGLVAGLLDKRGALDSIRAAAPVDNASASSLAGSDGGRRGGAWIQAVASNERLEGKFGQATLNDFYSGVTAGVDARIGAVTIGGAIATTHIESQLYARNSKNEGTIHQGGGYIAYDDGGTYANAIGSYFQGDIDTQRSVYLGGSFAGRATGTADTSGYAVGGSLGHRFAIDSATRFALQASGGATEVTRKAYTETGAGGLSLATGRERRNLYNAAVEGRLSNMVRAGGGTIEPYVGGGVRFNFGDLDTISTNRLIGAPIGTGSFVIQGAELSKTTALLNGGVQIRPSNDVTFGIGVESTFAKREREGRISASMRIRF